MGKTTKNEPADPPEAPRREVQWVALKYLRLDPLNPRLQEGMENASHSQLLSELAKEYELRDLGQSIADNGYFSEEPLVAVKNANNKTWTVVEGNRRLAALLLLENPDSAPKSLRDRWNKLSAERGHRVTEVPILEYETRNEITPYLGFRHITGVLPWRPYQKGRYISQQVENAKLSFQQIARIVGSKSNTVREHYVAYALVRQARDHFLIDTTFAEEAFGVLRRSLSDPDIRAFIGLNFDKSERELSRPLAKSKAGALKELFLWMFGDEETEPALSESRDVRKLGTVLANSNATQILRSTNNLDYAFQLSGGEERKLLENLNAASYNLDQALPLSIRHKKRKNIITALRRCRDTLFEILKHFPGV